MPSSLILVRHQSGRGIKRRGVDTEYRIPAPPNQSVDINTTYAGFEHLTSGEIPCNPPATGFPKGTYIFTLSVGRLDQCRSELQHCSYVRVPMPLTGLSRVDGFIRGLHGYCRRNSNCDRVRVLVTAPGYGIANFFLGARSPDRAW